MGGGEGGGGGGAGELVRSLEARVTAVTGLSPRSGTGHQLLSYAATGSGYHAHTDCNGGEEKLEGPLPPLGTTTLAPH